MTSKTKFIRDIYLYAAALVSLIFAAVGIGTIVNTAMKAYVFPKAEKSAYERCNQEPPTYGLENGSLAQIATEKQKGQLENLLSDYESWKKNNSGEECYDQERQGNYVDAITMLIISLPIMAIHWMIIRKDRKKEQ